MSSRTIGYLRVSTPTQSTQNQSHELVQYVKRHKMVLHEIVEETVSGTKSFRERKLGELLESVNRGDVILVPELSRLGRSLVEVLQILEICSERGVTVRSLKEGFVLDDTLGSKIMSTMLGLVSEIERSLISLRTREALQAKKAAGGVKLGRRKGSQSASKLDRHRESIEELLAKRVSQASIAKIIGCSPTTLNGYVKTRGLGKSKNQNQTTQ